MWSKKHLSYLTNKSRRYQATELWLRNLSNQQQNQQQENLKYFCGSLYYYCNPLVTLILSSQSIYTKHPPWRGYSNLHTSTYTRSNDYLFIGYNLLEYLLTHTPFNVLINYQESPTHLTPLAAACLKGNKYFIELLCRNGAIPHMKLNAYFMSK